MSIRRVQLCDESDYVIHKTMGLLNFLGGSFCEEDMMERSFAEIVDSVCRNGGKINVDISCRYNDKEWSENEI